MTRFLIGFLFTLAKLTFPTAALAPAAAGLPNAAPPAAQAVMPAVAAQAAGTGFRAPLRDAVSP